MVLYIDGGVGVGRAGVEVRGRGGRIRDARLVERGGQAPGRKVCGRSARDKVALSGTRLASGAPVTK
jgi:hypothetical protein